MASLEACACGIPVIVSEQNAIPGLEEQGAGFQIHHNKVELERALLAVLSSDSLKEKMGQSARRLIEDDYRIEKITDEIERLFIDTVDRTRRMR